MIFNREQKRLLFNLGVTVRTNGGMCFPERRKENFKLIAEYLDKENVPFSIQNKMAYESENTNRYLDDIINDLEN